MRWFLWFTLTAFLFLSACSDSSSANDSEQAAGEGEAIPTSIEGVNGFMQKGPFLSGSKVRVLELESGRTLKQTGRSFEAIIQTDDGSFTLNAQTMVSQYIELHAEGFYRNEVTGKESGAPISLYAITDVMMREGGKVNINLLTHLEYQRVVYLVTEKNMKVAAAKEQAQKEVLAMLNIMDNKGFGSSEDLSIVGETDADGALLAFSVLFQGERSEAQLTSLLQKVVNDLKEDGKWDDEDTKTAIADWAKAQDQGGNLTTIRGHVADWKLGSVPNFEKYVRNFWYSNYGLGECTTANERKVAKNKNGKSENKEELFICENNVWRVATETEIDAYDYKNDRPWSAGEFLERRIGSVTGTLYEYNGSEWEKTKYFSDGLCFSGDIWSGCDDGQNKASYWHDSNDNEEGGASAIIWPPRKNEGETETMKSVIDYCGGICGEASLARGSLTYAPYVDVIFDVVDNGDSAVYAYSWGGLCVAYSSDRGMGLELSQGSAIDNLYQGAYPSVTLPAAIDTVVNFAWSDFYMPAWAKEPYQSVNGWTAAKQLVAIQFRIQDEMGPYHFNIKAIGRKGTCQAKP